MKTESALFALANFLNIPCVNGTTHHEFVLGKSHCPFKMSQLAAASILLLEDFGGNLDEAKFLLQQMSPKLLCTMRTFQAKRSLKFPALFLFLWHFKERKSLHFTQILTPPHYGRKSNVISA